VFECNEILSKYLTSQPIHSSQRIKSGKDKTLVELKVIITYELIEMLLGFGEDVKVLQPVSLRNDLIDKLNRTLQQYHGE
jgi:predicted DNA-binding transcriptional regulator YafY